MYSEKLSPKKNILLFVLLGLGIAIWALSIAAANVEWYKETNSISGASTTVKYYLYEVHSEGCFSGACVSTTEKWSDVKSNDKLVNVHKATRGLLIAGLILNSFFWVFLVLYIVKEFVPKLDLVLRTKQSLFLLIGYLLLIFSFILLAISFLTYIGFSKAYADDIKANGGTCVSGPCKKFSGSDSTYKWGPSSGFALEVVCAFLGIVANVLYYFWQKSVKSVSV